MQELTLNIRACCMFFILALHLSYLLNLNVKQRKNKAKKKKKSREWVQSSAKLIGLIPNMLVNIEL